MLTMLGVKATNASGTAESGDGCGWDTVGMSPIHFFRVRAIKKPPCPVSSNSVCITKFIIADEV